MKFNIPEIINETQSLEYWQSVYGIKMGIIAHRVAEHIELRTRLAEAQNWKCCWCGSVMTEERKRWNSSTTEHVHPKSQGGPDDAENFAVACNRCNNKRGDMDTEDFMKFALENYVK